MSVQNPSHGAQEPRRATQNGPVVSGAYSNGSRPYGPSEHLPSDPDAIPFDVLARASLTLLRCQEYDLAEKYLAVAIERMPLSAWPERWLDA